MSPGYHRPSDLTYGNAADIIAVEVDGDLEDGSDDDTVFTVTLAAHSLLAGSEVGIDLGAAKSILIAFPDLEQAEQVKLFPSSVGDQDLVDFLSTGSGTFTPTMPALMLSLK